MHHPRTMLLRATSVAIMTLVFLLQCACDTTQTLTGLNTALSGLLANKTLAEQFVRDVKAKLEPTDPAYQKVMEDYETARAAYDDYLSAVKLGALVKASGSDLQESAEATQGSAANFLATATRSLKPGLDTRDIQFQRAIILPENLTQRLRVIPAKKRTELIKQFEKQIKWRSWGSI